jgi:hypothetical protein
MDPSGLTHLRSTVGEPLPMPVHNSGYSLSNRHIRLSGGRLRFDCTKVCRIAKRHVGHTLPVVKLANYQLGCCNGEFIKR